MKNRILAMLFVSVIVLDTLAVEDVAKQGDVRRAQLGKGVTLEALYIPPGEFFMGSTPEEKEWATGIEGGAQAGTERESYEGKEPRGMKVTQGFFMGRTEVTVGQFRRDRKSVV